MNSLTLSPEKTELIADVCQYLADIHPENATLQELGTQFSISPFHLQRLFKQVTGVSPRQYADNLRVEDFKSQVRQGQRITDAIYDVGFGSSSRLYERSDEHLGMTPSTYQKGGKGMIIFYSVVPCPLGQMLVAVTERGICKISLGDTSDALIDDMTKEFAEAELIPDEEGVGYWVEKIIAYLEGWQPHLDLPLDIRATAFQMKVWQQLQKIPVGETRTYSDIAEAIEKPTAVRAVANACARNQVALVIPCHRIIRKNQELGGYRWGIERKRALLEQEKSYQKQA